MDGRFVPNITIGPLVVKALRPLTENSMDCHLMIEDPDNYVADFRRAGADLISVTQKPSRIRSVGKPSNKPGQRLA